MLYIHKGVNVERFFVKAVALYIVLFIVLLTGCKKSSGGDDAGTYIAQPGTLTKYTTNITSNTITYNGTGYNCTTAAQCYAVLYNANVNGVDYVGVAVSQDPSSTTAFNLKMYFQSSYIPSSITLDGSNCTFKVSLSGSTYTYSSGSVTLNFVDQGNGTYRITTAAGGVTLTGGGLTITEIIALKVN